MPEFGYESPPTAEDLGYPTKEDFQCDWEDHHDDMYPEFAPEPIVVRCTVDADELVAYWDNDFGGFGLPTLSKFCPRHAYQWKADGGNSHHFVSLRKA